MITAKNLIKKYKDNTAVDNISLEVKDGESFAFLGPNGAGKTTTIKMFTTLLKPTKGEILINGYNAIKYPNKVRNSFGIVFQDQSLDNELTAYENMDFHGVIYGLAKNERRNKIKELLRYVDLWDRRKEYVRNFSGGMKRRLEVARGLMHKPKLLFLDEPTIGLDPQTRNYIWRYICDLNKKDNLTIFFTTHIMEEAEKYASRIAIIDKGRIIAQGSAEELKKENNGENLEQVFLKLIGYNLRREHVGSIDKMRLSRKVWARK